MDSTQRGSFVAPPTGVSRRGPKTSSERGRAYRERMRLLETALDADVARLRRTVGELVMRRTLADTYSLQRCHDVSGSLAKLVYKYYTLFQDSMAALPPVSAVLLAQHDPQAAIELETQYQSQAQFLQHIMDPNVIAGDLVGPLAILDQWRRYAASHGSFRARILSITTSGSETCTVVTLRARATGKITGATFYTLFPHAVGREEALIQKFLEREVSYNITNRYLFNADGRICCEIVDVGFLEGLVQAGATLKEVALLMDGSVISKHCTLKPKTLPIMGNIKPRSSRVKRPSPSSQRGDTHNNNEDSRRPQHVRGVGANRLGMEYICS